MKYTSEYRIPDIDDNGCCERGSFILINSAGYYEFDEPYGATHRKHGRKDYYLSYNHSGTMKVRSHGINMQVNPGNIFLFKPFEEQYYGQASSDPISNYWVHFTGYGVEEILIQAHLADGNIYNVGISDDIAGLFEKMIDEIMKKNPGYVLLTASILIQIISLAERRLTIENPAPKNNRQVTLNESIQYIHKNYSRKLTVAELSKIAHLSVSRYSCVFKSLTGLSPQQYIISFRLQKACELMQHTNLNIRQIALLTGFEDQLYFCRIFKKYKAATPSDYIAGLRK